MWGRGFLKLLLMGELKAELQKKGRLSSSRLEAGSSDPNYSMGSNFKPLFAVFSQPLGPASLSILTATTVGNTIRNLPMHI